MEYDHESPTFTTSPKLNEQLATKAKTSAKAYISFIAAILSLHFATGDSIKDMVEIEQQLMNIIPTLLEQMIDEQVNRLIVTPYFAIVPSNLLAQNSKLKMNYHKIAVKIINREKEFRHDLDTTSREVTSAMRHLWNLLDTESDDITHNWKQIGKDEWKDETRSTVLDWIKRKRTSIEQNWYTKDHKNYYWANQLRELLEDEDKEELYEGPEEDPRTHKDEEMEIDDDPSKQTCDATKDE